MKFITMFLLIMIISSCGTEEKIVELDPNEVQLNGYMHETLSDDLLVRIKATTDTFEIVDGISYEQSVDLYKRDLNPEDNLVIFEEMARVYNTFCKSRCSTATERMDVYRTLLLRSMYSADEAIALLELETLVPNEAKEIIDMYKLKAEPIGVIQR